MRYAFVLALFFLFCSSAAADDAASWAEVYRQVSQSSIEDVSVEKLAVAALKGVSKVDKNLRLGNDDTRLTLYYKGRVVKVLRKPEDRSDVLAWGKMTAQIEEAVLQKSEQAALRDFEMPSLLGAEMVKVLDKDSKFYADLDEVSGEKAARKRLFAARVEKDVLILKPAVFNKQTFQRIKEALEENSTAKAVVLDLRGCPGGMPGAAIETADLFLDGGIIAMSFGKEADVETYYNATSKEKPLLMSLFVLVDSDTASAAEVLAAALQEQGRATLIGTQTRGKFSKQKLVGLPDGGVLAVTDGFFTTPAGNRLHGTGISPDLCTFGQKDDADVVIQSGVSCSGESRENSSVELETALFLAEKQDSFGDFKPKSEK